MRLRFKVHVPVFFLPCIVQIAASGGLHWEALLKVNFEAVPVSVPVIALSFVYQVLAASFVI